MCVLTIDRCRAEWFQIRVASRSKLVTVMNCHFHVNPSFNSTEELSKLKHDVTLAYRLSSAE